MNKFAQVSMRVSPISFLSLFCGTLMVLVSTVQAQDTTSSASSAANMDNGTISTEGIVGDVDSGRRGPVLTFSTEVSADGSSAKILADTQIINEEFRKYPISVDFYVNGKLFSKQFRSLELPAPLGIDVPKELAPVPFNFSIVATLLHPNRQYVTIAQGAVTNDSSSTAALECTSTETFSDGSSDVVITGTVDSSISADNTLEFTLTDGDKSSQVTLSIAASASSTTREATGTATVQQGSIAAVSYDVSGSVEASGSVVSSIDVSSADDTDSQLTLSCQTMPQTASASTLLGDETDGSGLDNSNLGSVLNAPSGTDAGSGTALDGVGPNGEANFIPLDKVGGVEVVN